MLPNCCLEQPHNLNYIVLKKKVSKFLSTHCFSFKKKIIFFCCCCCHFVCYYKICEGLGNPRQMKSSSFLFSLSHSSQWQQWLPSTQKIGNFEAVGLRRIKTEIKFLGFLNSFIPDEKLLFGSKYPSCIGICNLYMIV